MAVLNTESKSYPVRVRNLSVHGALLEGTSLPAENQAISLKRGSLAMPGHVAWVADQHCGIRFAEPINVDDWVEKAGPVGQQRIDAAVAEFRNSSAVRAVASGTSRDVLLSPGDLGEKLLRSCERITEGHGMTVHLAEEVLKIEAIAHTLKSLGRGSQ